MFIKHFYSENVCQRQTAGTVCIKGEMRNESLSSLLPRTKLDREGMSKNPPPISVMMEGGNLYSFWLEKTGSIMSFVEKL